MIKNIFVRRKVWIAVPLLVLAAVSGIFYIQSAPSRTVRQFVRAVENRDSATILQLTDPKEVRLFALDRHKIETLLNQSVDQPVRFGGFDRKLMGLYGRGPTGRQFEAQVLWLDSKTLQPIPAKTRRGRFSGTVIARETDSGWKVGTTNFFYTTCFSRWNNRVAYSRVARKAGLSGRVSIQGDVIPLR